MTWRLVFDAGIPPSEFGIDLKYPDELYEANIAYNIYLEDLKKIQNKGVK